jgi:hypothetical protein
MKAHKTARGWKIGARVMNRTELKIEYNKEMKPIRAMCTGCREAMPLAPVDLVNSADIIMWMSNQYIEHRRLKHSQDDEVSQRALQSGADAPR